MNAVQQSAPDLVAEARRLTPELTARAAAIEAARQLPADISAKLAAAGFYRAYVPANYGGLAMHPARAMAGVEQLARADASAAWVAFIGMTTGLTLAGVGEAAAREIFPSPHTLITGVTAPSGKAEVVNGGFRVSGRWAWGSGANNADWIVGGCTLFESGEKLLTKKGAPRVRLLFFPRAAVTLLGDWDPFGLCGSGSGGFEVHNVFVPEAHAADFSRAPVLQSPLFCFPRFGLLALGISATVLGAARAACDEFREIARAKTPTGSRRTLAERPTVQSEFASVVAELRAARVLMYAEIERCWLHAKTLAGGDSSAAVAAVLPLELRNSLRLAATHAVRAGRRASARMVALAGGASVHRSAPLQRRFRDVHVAAQHMMVAEPTLELTGKTLLGVKANTAQL